jgi:RNA polymerase sigma factor (TIGR02999 family)
MLFHMEDQGTGPTPPGDITRLLRRWSEGDTEAMDELMPLVYGELKRLAAYYLRLENSPPSLPCTALVHEAYLRLVPDQERDWQDRVHFFAVASRVIRHILVDHARRQKAAKRDIRQKVSLDHALTVPVESNLDLVALDQSLDALSAIDPRKSRVVELRYFAGLSAEETAEAMGISRATVLREWDIAKLWLYRNMSGEAAV